MGDGVEGSRKECWTRRSLKLATACQGQSFCHVLACQMCRVFVSCPGLPFPLCVLCCVQPNAEAQFLEVKNAFTVLSDPKQRSDYDRKMRGVSSHTHAAGVLGVH